ncbi:MAG: Secretion system C-terminal sorting domain, partial [Bacteroidota bacterium]
GSYSTSTVWRAHLVNGLSINNGLSTGITLVSNTSLIRTVNPDEPTAEPSTVAGNEESLLLNSYPNPTGGSVTIRVSGLLPDQDTRIRIVDITGRSIYTEVIGSGYEIYEQVFDLYDHPAGIYLVMVEQNDRREFIRVLKQ